MSRLRRRAPDGEEGLDISALIDVVFILLIFFMAGTIGGKKQFYVFLALDGSE